MINYTQKQIRAKLKKVKSSYETAWAIREEKHSFVVCLVVCKKDGRNKSESLQSIDVEEIKKK